MVSRVSPSEVHRVVPTPARWELLVDGRQQVGRQHHELEVGIGEGIGRYHAPSADGGQHHHPGTARQGLGCEGRRRLERLFDGRGPGDPRLAGGTVEDPVVGGKRPGVAGRGTLARRGGPAFDKDQRLPFGNRPHPAEEPPAVADSLHVGKAHLGVRVRGVEG